MKGHHGMFEQYSKDPDNILTMQDVYKSTASSTSELVLVLNPVQGMNFPDLSMVCWSGMNFLH